LRVRDVATRSSSPRRFVPLVARPGGLRGPGGRCRGTSRGGTLRRPPRPPTPLLTPPTPAPPFFSRGAPLRPCREVTMLARNAKKALQGVAGARFISNGELPCGQIGRLCEISPDPTPDVSSPSLRGDARDMSPDGKGGQLSPPMCCRDGGYLLRNDGAVAFPGFFSTARLNLALRIPVICERSPLSRGTSTGPVGSTRASSLPTLP